MITKTVLKIALFVIANSSFAMQLETNCGNQIKQYGDGSGLDTFSAECQDFFIKNKSLSVKKSKEDLEVEISYFPGILIIDKTENNVKYREFISGNNTNLSDVDAIAINLDKKEVSILNKTLGHIRSYSTYITGNVSALREFKNSSFAHVEKIQFNTNEDKLLIINPIAKTLCYYNREANSLHRKGMRKDKALECKMNKTSISPEDL